MSLVPLGEGALARIRELDRLEEAYQAWHELRLEHAAARARAEEERRRLGDQADFMVGAVRAASDGTPPAEGGAIALDGFLRGAEEQLSTARAAIDARASETETGYAAAFAELRSVIKALVERYLAKVRPQLKMWVRPAGERRILHVERVSGDEAVLLLYLFSGKIPSRYDFLFDDSTDDVHLPPAPLYPDEGVAPDAVRPDAAGMRERVEKASEILPVKGVLPVLLPEGFFLLRERGPVMEVELADGPGFRNLLTREESERFAGHLVRLKLAGRIDLELAAG
jgi:hypothetical protein